MKTLITERRLTDNFHVREFLVSIDEPELARALEPGLCHVWNLHMQCVTILQPLRTYFGVPVIPLSGYRDYRLNQAVDGHEASEHLEAKATDFTTPDVALLPDMFEFIRDILSFAWWQLIYYSERNFIHAAIPHLGAPRICEVRGWDKTQKHEGG